MERKPGVLRTRTPEEEASIKAQMAEYQRERAEAEAKKPAIRAAGLEALKRLLPIAQGDSGQCRYVAAFLLGLYNGTRFPFDMTNFRGLDRKIFNDCMAVLAMDYQPAQEVHTYFENGGEIFENLAKDWNVLDVAKLQRQQRNG